MMAQVKQATDEAAAKAAEMGRKAVDAHKKATIEANNYEESVKRAAAAQKAGADTAQKATESATRSVQLHGHRISEVHGKIQLTNEEIKKYSQIWGGPPQPSSADAQAFRQWLQSGFDDNSPAVPSHSSQSFSARYKASVPKEAKRISV